MLIAGHNLVLIYLMTRNSMLKKCIIKGVTNLEY